MKERENIEPVSESSLYYFIKGMNSHNAVMEIIDAGDSKFIIKRTNGRSDLTVLVADIYIAGEADVYEVVPDSSPIDSLVLIGFYNTYSSAAKTVAKNMNIGLYTSREFFGALHYSGNAFLDYECKK